MTRIFLAALALACVTCTSVPLLQLGAAPALAAEAVATAPTSVTIPYGSWIGTYGLEFAGYAVSALSAVAAAAIARLWPVAASVLTQQRLQQAGQALAEYGINAIAGSTRDGKVTIPLGSAVVAEAVQRGINVLPGWLMKKAGGPEGLAAVIFRILPLEEGASKASVLEPAIQTLRQRGQA